MRRARRSVLFRYSLAAALAALTVPFIAHAAFGDEAVATPVAQVFPTRQGIGVVWDDIDATGYRVERKDAADWQDVSGTLTASTTTWIDESIAAGTTAEYRVVATSDANPATSPAVTATRVAEAPAIGDIDVLALDANRGAGFTWLQDETAGPVTASAPADGSRTLSAGSLKVKLPAFVAGPGIYNLPQTAVALTQGDRTCTTDGVLRVTAVSYTPDQQLETLAASLGAWSCAGSAITAMVEIRYQSAIGYQALSVTPTKLDAGRVMVGSSKAFAVTLKNTGTEPVQFGNMAFSGSASPDWTLSRACGLQLPAGDSCTATVTFEPREGRDDYWARLVIGDSTALHQHTVEMVGTGTSLPKAPQVFNVMSTYRGLTLVWQTWKSAGGTPVRGYFVHRYLDGQEKTQWVDPAPAGQEWVSVADPSPKPGTEYALSVVNEIGEGPTGPRVKATRPAAQIALTDGKPAELLAAGLAGYVVPFVDPRGSAQPKEAVTSAPDGGSLAYVTSNFDKILWTQRVQPSEVGVPVKLWTSPTGSPITHLSWSPDGTRIAFQSPENGTPCVYVIAATGGTAEKVACDLTSPSWMPDAQTLVVVDRRLEGDDRFIRIQARPGGAKVATLPAATAAADGMPVRVSPDGRLVAFGSERNVKLVDFTSDKVSSSPPLESTVRSISWNPEGGSLLALSGNDQMFTIYTDRVDWNPIKLANSDVPGQRLDMAWQRLGPTIAPTPAVVGPRASIAFDASALLPGTTFTCSAGGATQTACTSPYTATGLRSGENTVTITATEPDGRVTKAFRLLTADDTAPVARMVAPTYQGSTAATATLKVSATDANGVAAYDVRYRRASFAGPYGAYVQPWTNTTATSMNLSIAAGYEYCASVRAKDKFGNIGQWSTDRCFSRPLDDRSMTTATTGWTRASWSVFYYGTATQTTAYGKALTRTVQGKRFFLVATRCSTCGSVAVYAGSKYLTTINLAASTTQRQVLIGLPVQSTLFSGTLTFSTRSTGKLVQIDGLAVGRT
ncbi:choice-of-anchor D domain-containing protein [Kribbella sp. VKM Ac-2568]|uniref:choice-of-anchor D domain-containing protein n=1 Tax=Kribbella sp. VKM Ac-2568 TaxID=2512219 RepID=UPI00104785D3|nr:choice-of-anchor D domain-containing protein [Kribbella sp. VKM Ac-2568]TCM46640.1 WD40 repeat protein [Kribbella sp. VKM Ac-2568]